MKILTRDSSAYRFMTLGGLYSHKLIASTELLDVPSWFTDTRYRQEASGFGPDEENVRRFIISFLKEGLGWKDVRKSHDVIAEHDGDKLLIECKRFDSTLLYLDDHKGGSRGETAVQELRRNLKELDIKWGVLTDGVSFRLYHRNDADPTFDDLYIEVCLKDIVNSIHRWPIELNVLMDFLSPNSKLRSIDPTRVYGLADVDVRTIMRVITAHNKSLRTTLKALAVAALEDMGVRPLHTGILSIKSARTKAEYLSIFGSILTNDPSFHSSTDFISDTLCSSLNGMFQRLSHVDFAHVDHEFFGIIYQKYIHNGNASHYTNTELSREMANYISSQSEKSQRQTVRAISLSEGDYILDPALGSGQLLRSLLPFHKVFFGGRTSGIEGWRELATHFMGRDIDSEAIWVAKINIWLATAEKGVPFIKLDEFQPLDVISATINRRGGASIKDALLIEEDKKISACVSNPPWDAFKNDSRREVQSFDRELVARIKQSLALTSKQLNRAQIFLKIIHLLGIESRHMRFAVVLPDSIFVDQNDDLRESIIKNIDFYFSYPRNFDSSTKKRIFSGVDNTRKFGIIFGRSQTDFENVICYPCGIHKGVVVSEELRKLGSYNVLPLLSHPVQAKIIIKWKNIVARNPKWHEGEFHQTNWNKVEGREESTTGDHFVIKGTSFCREDSAWADSPTTTRFWKRMSSISDRDLDLCTRNRVIFSDYINNSKKLNSATFLPGDLNLNLANTLLYSAECQEGDHLIYDSAIFSVFVEAYGTSQHMNGFRLQAIGLPNPIAANDALAANFELIQLMGLTLQDALDLYSINEHWLSQAISREDWKTRVGAQQATVEEEIEVKIGIEHIKKKVQEWA